MSLITTSSYQDLQWSYPTFSRIAPKCEVCYYSLAKGADGKQEEIALQGHTVGTVAHIYHQHCVKQTFSEGYGNCPQCRIFLVHNASVIVSFKSFEDMEEQCGASDDSACGICLKALKPEEEVENTRLLGHLSEKVAHVFHEQCMVQELARRQRCPTCRTVLNITNSSLQEKVDAVIIPLPVASNQQPHVPQPPPAWEERAETVMIYVVAVSILSALYSIVVGIALVVELLLSGAPLLVALETAVVVAGMLFLLCMGVGLAVGVCLAAIDLALEGFAWAGRQIELLFV